MSWRECGARSRAGWGARVGSAHAASARSYSLAVSRSAAVTLASRLLAVARSRVAARACEVRSRLVGAVCSAAATRSQREEWRRGAECVCVLGVASMAMTEGDGSAWRRA